MGVFEADPLEWPRRKTDPKAAINVEIMLFIPIFNASVMFFYSRTTLMHPCSACTHTQTSSAATGTGGSSGDHELVVKRNRATTVDEKLIESNTSTAIARMSSGTPKRSSVGTYIVSYEQN